jgi:hypothetical protein
MRRPIAATALMLAGALLGVGGSAVAHRDAGDTVRFDRSGGNHPTDVHRIVVDGSNCLESEDSAALRLDNWDPANDRVVYHCVQPKR